MCFCACTNTARSISNGVTDRPAALAPTLVNTHPNLKQPRTMSLQGSQFRFALDTWLAKHQLRMLTWAKLGPTGRAISSPRVRLTSSWTTAIADSHDCCQFVSDSCEYARWGNYAEIRERQTRSPLFLASPRRALLPPSKLKPVRRPPTATRDFGFVPRATTHMAQAFIEKRGERRQGLRRRWWGTKKNIGEPAAGFVCHG